MTHPSTSEINLIILRALALYAKDQISNGDMENAKDTTDLIYTLSHEVNIDG